MPDEKNRESFARLTHRQKVDVVVQMICETGRQHGELCLPSMLTGMETAMMLIRGELSQRVIKAGIDQLATQFGLSDTTMKEVEIPVRDDVEGN